MMGDEALERSIGQLRHTQTGEFFHRLDPFDDFFFDLNLKSARRTLELVIITHELVLSGARSRFNPF